MSISLTGALVPYSRENRLDVSRLSILRSKYRKAKGMTMMIKNGHMMLEWCQGEYRRYSKAHR